MATPGVPSQTTPFLQLRYTGQADMNANLGKLDEVIGTMIATGDGLPGPPAGPAGGDLAGSYPNPLIGPLAVSDTEISSVAWAKLIGTPPPFAPGGPASGDLEGSYPGPTVRPLAITRLKLAEEVTLPPIPTASDIGQVVTVAGDLSLTYAVAGGSGGTALWQDDPNNDLISPLPYNRSLLLSSGRGIQWGLLPDNARLTGLYADDGTLFLRAASQGILVQTDPIGGALLGISNATGNVGIGPAQFVGVAVERLQVDGGLKLAAAINTAPATLPGTIQYTGGRFQGRNATAWVNLDEQSLPPSGSAGGDLAGTYPNPTVARATAGLTIPAINPALLVGTTTIKSRLSMSGSTPPWLELGVNASVTGAKDDNTRSAWRLFLGGAADTVVVGREAPGTTSLVSLLTVKPTGEVAVTANPTLPLDLATKQYVDAITATGPAGGDLTGTYPNPAISATAKSKWMVSGTTLTPTDATHVAVLAPVTNPLQWGVRPLVRHRLVAHATADASYWTLNMALNAGATAWLVDDASKPGWHATLDLAQDNFRIRRAPIGSVTPTDLLGLDAVGNLTLGDPIKSMVQAGTALSLRFNRDLAGVQADATRPGWVTNCGGSGASDNWVVFRGPPGGGTLTALITLDSLAQVVLGSGTAIKTGGGPWAAPSDRRIKRDITDYTTGLDAILALRPISFSYNGLGGTMDDGKTYHGLIADEVESVMPEMVTTRPGLLRPEDVDPVMLQQLNTGPLIFALIRAVQTLHTRLAAVEAP